MRTTPWLRLNDTAAEMRYIRMDITVIGADDGQMIAKTPKKRGRPSRYTEEIAVKICRRLAAGESLRSICRDEALPHESTVRAWAVDDHKGFSTQYARARDLGLEAMADEILEICDDGSNDWMERLDKDGEATGWQLNGEHVQRSRLRADARKWLLSKLAPKRYGDRLQHVGDGGGPIRVRPDLSKLTDEDLDVLERILGRATDA